MLKFSLLYRLVLILVSMQSSLLSANDASRSLKQEEWRVESLGNEVYVFHWLPGFYVSVFVAGDDGVLAFDPINREVAGHYRDAIATVSEKPVTHIVYSHDHRDHIVGADVLASSPVIYAHPNTAKRIKARADKDIPPPTELVEHGDEIVFNRHRLRLYDFAPNHSSSNLLAVVETGRGNLLVWVDGVEPGIAPYRNLPDTDIGGLMVTLREAGKLDVDLVIGGHAGPADARWLELYRQYFDDLLASTRSAYAAHWGSPPLPGEDGVAATERVIALATNAAAAEMVRDYPDWLGIEEWAPLNASRMLSYLITGN